MYIIVWKSDGEAFTDKGDRPWSRRRSEAKAFDTKEEAVAYMHLPRNDMWIDRVEYEYIHPLNLCQE
jgi:hypothetical protein